MLGRYVSLSGLVTRTVARYTTSSQPYLLVVLGVLVEILVEMQRSPLSVFSWPRGRPELWRVSLDARGRRPPLLVYDEGWPQPWDNRYQPLEDAPRLYEDFADVGFVAFRMGARLTGTPADSAFWPYDVELEETESEVIRTRFRRPVRPTLVEGSEDEVRQGRIAMGLLPLDEQVAASSAEAPAFQKVTLEFVRQYGPPRDLTDAELRPRLRGSERLVGMPLTELSREAWLLYQSVSVAKEVREGEEKGLADEKFKAKQVWLQARVSERLRGVSPILAYEPDHGRLVPAFSCNDLLSAMWLQFYESMAAGKTWRLCKGCGRLFTLTDPRQEYHDVPCRNRSHARRFGKKSRGKKAH